MHKVSIIIPVFKVENFIERCVSSVLNQTYRKLEVILIDDCSPDRSMEIAMQVIEKSDNSKDLEFQYLKHDKNRGLSAARNTGINAATGNYVLFLDSDDAIEEDAIMLLAKEIQNKEIDFTIGDYTIKGIQKKIPGLFMNEGAYNAHQIKKAYRNGQFYMMAWGKLCNLKFIKNNRLYFKEGLIHEDELWTFMLVCKAQSMYVCREPIYIYNIREDSITTNQTTRKKVGILFMILGYMRKYQTEQHLQKDILIDGIIERFIRRIWGNAKKCGYSRKTFYYNMRKADGRSWRERYDTYDLNIKRLIKNSHYLLPASLGYFEYKIL